LRKNEKLKMKNEEFGFQKFCINENLEPHCRLDAGLILKNYVSSMIDISDGLASEVRHICEQSKVGAIVYKSKIPLSKEVIAMGKFLNKDPYQWALSGGEDFELCYTISKINYKKLSNLKSFKHSSHIVGEILPKSKGLHLIDFNGKKLPMPKGYEHF